MPHTSRRAVLIVDDDPSILQLLSLCLRDQFAVTVVTSGAEGLAEFERRGFDLVISDRAMPEMPGNVFAAMIKERVPEMPIILISGQQGPEVDTTLFSGFLRKPFTKTELLETVGVVLEAA